MKFTVLERGVLDWVAEHAHLESLRSQIGECNPTDRELTGVGSFTRLSVPRDLAEFRIEKAISPIYGPEISGLPESPDSASSLVFVDDDGHIEMLEICAHGDSFDECAGKFTLSALEED